MSRKNLLSSLTERKLAAGNSPSSTSGEGATERKLPSDNSGLSPAMERNRGRGAFGAITKSIDELAEQAETAKQIQARLLEGATVIDLDTDLIDVSFIEDRLEDDAPALSELIDAIRERGQDSPILVRPHPNKAGRFMVVFGHRRLRAAKALSRPVRAVVKDLSERDHVIAQGQENSARSNLSFIERAMFASALMEKGHGRDVVMAALAIDKTLLSKLLSTANDIPKEIIRAIGAAKNNGREPWYKLAKLLRDDTHRAAAFAFIESAEFREADSDQKLSLLLASVARPERKPAKTAASRQWTPTDRSARVTAKAKGKTLSMEFSSPNGRAFGEWISNNLEGLYETFRQSGSGKTGD
ncbi:MULTISPECIES: plasmid partitioning protein RepB [unclassified Brucella]|uniref:plasmid partitioning protein RepB n=1 Tax=unclassified Brucella TaxID=2632610 RepID=UPI0012ADB915|nr:MULTISPECIES: plasmid partitioning protein RepB [unclassified Brucella]MRN43483.1 plasmid partitioning protein RepB [Brucella sp. 09RB8913]MRN59397.1 plasmid partitioning protein RepB [Brucella sp. 09RB8918]MRN67947.1 plasmid partitioning protein RepB [Brucella sp. 10RB9213]